MPTQGRTSAEIFWSDEDSGWIAIDRLRPGCSAWGSTEKTALRELQDARIAWDRAKIAAAPELLEAAKAALAEMCNTIAPRNSFTDAVDLLDAAIAKATGQTEN